MTQNEKDAKLAELQTEAKEYQAEVGFLTVQVAAANKRLADLTVLLTAGEQKFAQVRQTRVDGPADSPPFPEEPEHA